MSEERLEVVRFIRSQYGSPLTNEEMGLIVNAVALTLGLKLAGKPTGVHTRHPVTGRKISRDIIIDPEAGRMYDIMRDVAGFAEPTWNDVGPIDMVPVDPLPLPGADPRPDPDPDDDPPLTEEQVQYMMFRIREALK